MKKHKINISEERHNKSLESLGSIFIPIVKGSLSAQDLIEIEIICRWHDIVGKELSSFCFPMKTKYDPKQDCRTLIVEVPLGGYALEMQHKEHYLLEKINAYFGYKAVHKLNITQNANRRPVFVENKVDKNSEKVVSPENMAYLTSLTAEIKDEKLREILIKIGKNVLSNE